MCPQRGGFFEYYKDRAVIKTDEKAEEEQVVYEDIFSRGQL